MEVKISRGLFARQRREKEKREQRSRGVGINEMLSDKSDTLNILAPYKLQPEILPFLGERRRIPRSCKKCVSADREEENEDAPALGIGNCFLLNNRNKNKPLTRRVFAEMYHYWDRGGRANNHKNLVCTVDILNYPKFQNLQRNINEIAASETSDHGAASTEISVSAADQEIIDKFIAKFGIKPVKTWMSRIWLRFSGWILSKVFSFIFDGICYHKGTLHLLKTVSDSGLPIIYIPLYKSCLDSYLLSWFLLTSGVPTLPLAIEPRTRFQLPFISNKLLGGFGASGTGSNLKSGFYSKKDNLALYSYLRLSLKKANHFQFGLEPRRPRNGKPSCFPSGGELLNVIVDMLNKKEIEDAYIVPLSISYEKLPEEHILEYSQTEHTLTNYNKTLSFVNLLSKNLGYARIDLSQPFRLRDFKIPRRYENYKSYQGCVLPIDSKSSTLIPGRELQWNCKAGSVASMSSIYGEPDPFDQEDDLENGTTATDYYEEEDDSFLTELSQHIMYDAMKTTTFMSTNLLSFLLIKKFRDGTTLESLVEEMDSLCSFVHSRKRDVGFTGDLHLVTQRAITILGPSLVAQSRNQENEIIVKPILTTKSVITLGYYASCLVQLYIREACVSTAIFAHVGLSQKAVLNTSFALSTSEDQLVQSTLEVCQLMKGEFILNPPCESTDTIVRQTIDMMNDYSFLYIHKKKGFTNYDDFDEDSNDEFDDGIGGGIGSMKQPDVAVYVEKIEFINEENISDHHNFLRNLVVPYLEFFRAGVTVLMKLVPHDDYVGEKEELELRKEILEEVKLLLASSKYFKAEEIITIDTARNFLYHMTSMRVIDSYSDNETQGKRLYYLTDGFATAEKMEELLRLILRYITYP